MHPDGSSRRSSIISKRSSSSINVSSAPKKTAKAIFDYAAQSEQQISVIGGLFTSQDTKTPLG